MAGTGGTEGGCEGIKAGTRQGPDCRQLCAFKSDEIPVQGLKKSDRI